MKKIIVGVTGASGAELGLQVLSALRECGDVEIHLVISEGAKRTIAMETTLREEDFYSLSDFSYQETEMGARISSGSFFTDGMIVVPCSMKTLAGLACGYDENLVIRAADVCLKEGRKVVVVPREMPLGRSHLRNMLTLAEYGCVVIPPMLTFYSKGRTLEEQMAQIVGKILMQFGMEYRNFKSWDGTKNDGEVCV